MLGEASATAKVVRVLVAEGQYVKAQQVIFELETDKVFVEIPADISGVVQILGVTSGDSVQEGDFLARIVESDPPASEETDEKYRWNDDSPSPLRRWVKRVFNV